MKTPERCFYLFYLKRQHRWQHFLNQVFNVYAQFSILQTEPNCVEAFWMQHSDVPTVHYGRFCLNSVVHLKQNSHMQQHTVLMLAESVIQKIFPSFCVFCSFSCQKSHLCCTNFSPCFLPLSQTHVHHMNKNLVIK